MTAISAQSARAPLMLAAIFLGSALSPAAAQPAQADGAASLPSDAIVVTGSRLGSAPVERLGSSITVLDAAALELRQTRTVSDILRDVPGLAVSRTGAPGGLTQVRIRGAEGNHTLVLIDGIEASDPFQGEFDFGGLIAEPAARVEVLRGQQSALYGSDAIGGVVQYITASGREQPGLSARAEGGSFGSFNAAARAGGATERFDYTASTAYTREDGYPVADGGTRDIGSETLTASSKLNYLATDALRFRAVARYSRTEADSTGTSATTFAPIDGNGRYTNRSFMGLLRAEFDALDGRWLHALTGQINDNKRVTYGGVTGDTRTSANEGSRVKASYDTRLTLGSPSAQHVVTLAADFEREEFRNLPPASPQPLSNTRRIDNRGLVADYRFSAGDRLSIGASLRRDWNNQFDDATTYRMSGSIRLAGPLRIRAAYGTAIKNPTPFELYGFSNLSTVFTGNPNLKPEKSKGWEAGADLVSSDGRFSLGATWFDSRLKNEIFSDRIGTASTPGNRTTNSKQKGIEIFAAVRLAETLRIDGAYTHLDAEENGLEEIRRAPNIASLNVTWQPLQALSLTGTARYNGRTIDSNFTTLPVGPRVRLDDFTLVNLAAEWKLLANITLFGRIENLLDEDYSEAFGFRSPGRGAYGGMRLAF